MLKQFGAVIVAAAVAVTAATTVAADDTSNNSSPENIGSSRAPTFSGWIIQIAATRTQASALAILRRASAREPKLLANAVPYAEVAVNEGVVLYRARFGGFGGEEDARAACTQLIEQNFSCLALRVAESGPSVTAPVEVLTGPRIKELSDDTDAWRRARIIDSPASYHSYISDWPDGRFVDRAKEGKSFQESRKLDRADVLAAINQVADYVASSELSLGNLRLEYAPAECMADQEFQTVYKGFGIAVAGYYAFNSALKGKTLDLNYPYTERPQDPPNEINFRRAISALTGSDIDAISALVSHSSTLREILISPEILSVLDLLIAYKGKFDRQVDTAVLKLIDDGIWERSDWGDWDLFYDLGFERDACLSQPVYVRGLKVRNDDTYVSSAIEPWAYGFWYRRTIEGSSGVVFSSLNAARSLIASGKVGNELAAPKIDEPDDPDKTKPVKQNPHQRQTVNPW